MALDGELKKLMEKKAAIETEINEYQEVLKSQGDVGMTGSLVDDEQFPRTDIDLYIVRQARHRIICLQNDYKALMKEIEQELYQYHEQLRQNNRVQPMDIDEEQRQTTDLKPFARIDLVDAGSPADNARLKVGDLILRFGSVTCNNFETMQALSTIVQHSKGKSLSVSVLRGADQRHLSVTPNTWSGRGLLGCNIVPLPK